jgi:hypothetical protein
MTEIEKEQFGDKTVFSVVGSGGKRVPIIESGPSGFSLNLAGPPESAVFFSRYETIQTASGWIAYDKQTGDVTWWESKSGLFHVEGDRIIKK